MEEVDFIRLLDQADADMDAFPFWATFKRACAAHPIKGIDNLTPGRQAVLILWEANTQTSVMLVGLCRSNAEMLL